MLVTVDTSDLLHFAGFKVPDVEVAAAGGEEDTGVVGMECGCRERSLADVQGSEERVGFRCRRRSDNVVEVEG
jgi:hypothetical protein